MVVNGRREPARAPLDTAGGVRPLAVHGVELAGGEVRAAGFSYGVFELLPYGPGRSTADRGN